MGECDDKYICCDQQRCHVVGCEEQRRCARADTGATAAASWTRGWTMPSRPEAKKMLEVLMLMMLMMLMMQMMSMMLMMLMMLMMMTELEEAVWAATVTNAAAWRAHTYTRND
jgi:hypothetical protein